MKKIYIFNKISAEVNRLSPIIIGAEVKRLNEKKKIFNEISPEVNRLSPIKISAKVKHLF